MIPDPVRKWLATGLAVLAVAEVIGTLLISSSGDPRFTVGVDVVSIGFLGSVVLFTTVGALIVQRRPATRVAWFMIVAGIGLGAAVVDTSDKPAGTSGQWPQPVAERIQIPAGRHGLNAILVGARRDGQPTIPARPPN